MKSIIFKMFNENNISLRIFSRIFDILFIYIFTILNFSFAIVCNK